MRTAIRVDLPLLQRIIDELTANADNTRHGQIEFFKRAALKYNVDKRSLFQQITHSIVMLRIKSGDVQCSVEKSRTFTKGQPKILSAKEPKALSEKDLAFQARTYKARSKILDLSHAEQMRKTYPDEPKLVNRILRGSLTAMIKLNCKRCVGWQLKEIRNCTLKTCPFWSKRPYQKT